MAKSISELIMEYFEKHPKEDLKHGPIVDELQSNIYKLTANLQDMYGEQSENYTRKVN